MESIAVLHDALINQIAAGEVIERPASVVKELLENALDAGAENIRIDLEEGGLKKITVTDDGHGMDEANAHLCILKHATSKMRDLSDLNDLHTFGFRGEALAAIASIAHVQLTTRPSNTTKGYRIVLAGGVIESAEHIGCPVGTSIEVGQLFFNTPARRKFMRSAATEQTHVLNAVIRVMLAARHAGVVVANAQRRLLDIPNTTDFQKRLDAIWGVQSGDMLAIDTTYHGVRVSGVLQIATKEHMRGTHVGMWFFVNGRFVRDRMLQRAVTQIYPAAATVLFIDMPSCDVDINVHPQKIEVRFINPYSIFNALRAALLAAKPHERTDDKTSHKRLNNQAHAVVISDDSDNQASLSHTMPQTWHVLGDILVLFLEDQLALIKWQDVQKKWVMQQLLMQQDQGKIALHACVLPEMLHIQQDVWLEKNYHTLQRFGFVIEPVGPYTYAIRSIPYVLFCANVLIVSAAQALVDAACSQTSDTSILTACIQKSTYRMCQTIIADTAYQTVFLHDSSCCQYIDAACLNHMFHRR